MRTSGCLVDVISLPDTVLQLYDRVVDHQGYCDIDLHVHIVLDLYEQLALLLPILIAEFLANAADADDICLSIYFEVDAGLFVLVVLGRADCSLQLDIALEVVGIEVEEHVFAWDELENVIS